MSAVVKLPSAARRQVQQRQNKEARAARLALREQQCRTFPYRNHTMREADQIADAIHPMTAERWTLVALISVLEPDAFEKIAKMGHLGHATIRGLFQLAKGSFGLQMDIMSALELRATSQSKGGEA